MEWNFFNELVMDVNSTIIAYAIFFAIGILSVKVW